MKQEGPQRIALFGLPGSGKSTFADRLGKILNIPVHHLDRHFFVENWKERDRQEFLSIQQTMVDQECWIIEGNSIASLEMRFARADVVIYFHFTRFVCLWRVFKRLFIHDKTILDIPDGCSKNVSWRLLKYLWGFNKEKKERIEELKKKYPDVDFYIFGNSKSLERYIANVKNDVA